MQAETELPYPAYRLNGTFALNCRARLYGKCSRKWVRVCRVRSMYRSEAYSTCADVTARRVRVEGTAY